MPVIKFPTKPKTTKKATKKRATNKKLAASKAAAKPLVVPTPTFVTLVMDHSTSMGGHAKGAIEMLNAQFATLVSQDKHSNMHVTVLGFADDVLPPSQRDVRPEWLKEVRTWQANGNTALFDGIDEAMNLAEQDQNKLIKELQDKLEALPKRTLKAVREKAKAELEAAKNASFWIIGFTDGEENWSTRFGPRAGHHYNGSYRSEPAWDKFSAALKSKIATDKWTFTFQMPPDKVGKFLNNTGLPPGNIVGWGSMQEAKEQLTAGSVKYFGARARGATAVADVFVANTVDLKKKDLRGYEDISSQVKVWLVEKEEAIQPFVESHGQVYVKGNAFFQLTKKEEVQGYKDVLIAERNVDQTTGKETLGKIYKNARDLIGLPANTVKVAPGDLSNKFVLFIQSTSLNRRLVRGTRVIYLI